DEQREVVTVDADDRQSGVAGAVCRGPQSLGPVGQERVRTASTVRSRAEPKPGQAPVAQLTQTAMNT
ncbi:hypothetical protein, partial [Frankia sp. Cr1]|uniref:hypothetical protein n=1 Tax=Frankia sp. Cr1 TaxID=3073931 RepID=UPI002AD3B4B2